MKNVLVLVFLSALLLSCTSKTEYQTVKVKNNYSLELPNFLSEAQHLNTEASLQYQNPLQEFYVIVLDEQKIDRPDSKQTNLEEYVHLMRKNLQTTLGDPVFSEDKDTLINGLEAKLFAVSGKMQDVKIYYKFAYIESTTHFYQILTWTLENRKDKFSSAMDRIIASFQELKKKSPGK